LPFEKSGKKTEKNRLNVALTKFHKTKAYLRLMKLQETKIGIISLGWLGARLAEHFSQRGALVWGTSRNSEKMTEQSLESAVEVVYWNQEEGLSSDLQVKLKPVDLLILNLPPSVFKNGNYATGLVQFLPFISSEANVIFTSSTGVYPSNLYDAREDYEFSEGETNKLLEAELALRNVCGKRLTILRLAGLIGEDRHPVHYLVKKEVNENPEGKVNLIHRKDIIQIVDRIIERDFWGEILNVCHPDHPSRKSYYTAKAKLFALRLPKFVEASKNEDNKIVNCNKLIDNLGYASFESL
jgi:nucleoside-diphosphate-sugar epimerase